MKKPDKDKMKSIMEGRGICLKCEIGYHKAIVNGKCVCIEN